MINFYSIVGVGLVAAVFATMLKPMKSEYSALLILGAGVVMLFWTVQSVIPLLDMLYQMSMNVQISSAYLEIVIKALGLGFITRLGVDCCRDVGQTAIGSNIELCGRIAILILILPLFVEVIDIINTGLSL